jgi:hypothetical protein
MSTVGGAFSETDLRNFRVKADELLFDDRIKLQFIPQINILKAIQAVQTATIKEKFQTLKQSNGGAKQYDIEVMWPNACDIVAQSCTTCDIDGPELSTNAQVYSLDFCKEVPFSVDEFTMRSNEFDFEELIAKGMLKADVELANAIAAYSVSVLNANKGTNVLTTGPGVPVGSDTYIAPSFWGPGLMAYLTQVTMMNQFTSPVLASGANFFQDYFIVNGQSGNVNAPLYNTFPIFFDQWNIDTVNTPNLFTYLLSMGSLALASVNYNPTAVTESAANWKRWQVPSKFIPGVTYDAFYKAVCSNDMVTHQFKYKLTGDVLVNPAGCSATNTGILTFICGSGT